MVFGTRHREPLVAVSKAYADGLVPKILVSGGKNRENGRNEAEEMAVNLIDLGVATDDIIVEDKSTNTLENVLFSRPIIEEEIGFQNVRRLLVVVKNYHSRRAVMTLKRHFPQGVEFLPLAYDLLGITRDNWHQSEIGRKKVEGEMERIEKYLAKGDIAEL